jgi:hypothetical protein
VGTRVSHTLTFNNAFSRCLKPLSPKAGPQFSLLAAFAIGLHGAITRRHPLQILSYALPGVSGHRDVAGRSEEGPRPLKQPRAKIQIHCNRRKGFAEFYYEQSEIYDSSLDGGGIVRSNFLRVELR